MRPAQMGETAERKRRLRIPDSLLLPAADPAPYSSERPEIAAISLAERVLLVRQTDAWEQVMVPACQRLDQQRSKTGRKFLYTSEELELVLLFGRAAGMDTYRDTRNLLAGDRAAARVLLGFDVPRNAQENPKRALTMVLRDGVPSEATMSRHRKRFTDERRDELWREIEKRIRLEHLEQPELLSELGNLQIDGSALLTHYRCPVRKKGRAGMKDVPVTCPTGGWMPTSAGPDKSGHGWNLIPIQTSNAVPLDWDLVPLNESEKDTALALVEGSFAENTAPKLVHLGHKVSVLTADGAFHKPELRAALRQHGVIENIHFSSHDDSPKKQARAARLSAERHKIVGYADWFANGHREVICRCGIYAAKRISKNAGGKVISRVEGKCERCGSVSITSGQWRLSPDGRFVRCVGKKEKRDWALGNGLTFNDPVAYNCGKSRFNRQEGLFSTLSNAKLLRYKRWFTNIHQARIEVSMQFALMHAVSIEGYRRRQTLAPPGRLALAA